MERKAPVRHQVKGKNGKIFFRGKGAAAVKAKGTFSGATGKQYLDKLKSGDGTHGLMSSSEQAKAKNQGFFIHKSGTIINYDADRKDYYVHTGVHDLSSTMNLEGTGIKNRAYFKKNKKEHIHSMFKS